MKAQQQKHFLSTGQNLLRFREEKGLSLQELANRSGVDTVKINKIENGETDFKFSTLLEIAVALDVDVNSFVASSGT